MPNFSCTLFKPKEFKLFIHLFSQKYIVSIIKQKIVINNYPNTDVVYTRFVFRSVPLFYYYYYFYFFVCAGSSLLRVGFSLVAMSGGYSLLQCAASSLWWLLLLRSMGSRNASFSSCSMWAQQLQHTGIRVHGLSYLWHVSSVVAACRLQSTGSVVVAHRLSCSVACGIFLDQGSNLFPLRWQADS